MVLASGDSQTNQTDRRTKTAELPWFRKLSRPILFLTISGGPRRRYLAFSIPVAVFPTRISARRGGSGQRVMPIDQMLVTITRPIEEAVNSVPACKKVTSITSRGSAEVDLYFDWNFGHDFWRSRRVDAVVALCRRTFLPRPR